MKTLLSTAVVGVLLLVVEGVVGYTVAPSWIVNGKVPTTEKPLSFVNWYHNLPIHANKNQEGTVESTETTTVATVKLPPFLEMATNRPQRHWHTATIGPDPSAELQPHFTNGPPEFKSVTPAYARPLYSLYTVEPRFPRITVPLRTVVPYTIEPPTISPFTIEPRTFRPWVAFTVPRWIDPRIPRDPPNPWFK